MKYKFIILSLSIAAFFSCDEDTIRPLIADDGVSPSPIQNVVVKNTAGGAILTYNLPNDADLLYVEAQYKRNDNAEVSKVRAYIFNNSLEVFGFAEEKNYDVTLYAVDQSENKSEPITTTISPEKPPIQYVCESIKMFPDFGGMFVSWENPFLNNISFEVSVLDEFGEPTPIEVIYSEAEKGNFAIRGFDAVEQTFIIVVKDRYGNTCPPKTSVITPYFEEAVDKVHHKTLAALGLTIPHETPAFNNNWRLELIYNGDTRTIVRQTFLSSGAGWVDPDGELPGYEGLGAQYFTLDIGKQIQLSRILMHTDAFIGGTPKVFDIYGANTLNTDGSLDGWVKIVDKGETIRPSGTPFGVDPTTEDIEAAARGIDILVEASAPSVRYIRFVNRLSWENTTIIKISELEFFGKIID